MAIDIIEDDEFFMLIVGGETIMTTCCKHHCRKHATLLERARASSQRTAMKILTDDLGYCEGAAEFLFGILHDATPSPHGAN